MQPQRQTARKNNCPPAVFENVDESSQIPPIPQPLPSQRPRQFARKSNNPGIRFPVNSAALSQASPQIQPNQLPRSEHPPQMASKTNGFCCCSNDTPVASTSTAVPPPVQIQLGQTRARKTNHRNTWIPTSVASTSTAIPQASQVQLDQPAHSQPQHSTVSKANKSGSCSPNGN